MHDPHPASRSSDLAPGGVDRRGFLRLGGLGVTLAAVVAACGNDPSGEGGRVGEVPPTTGLPDVSVDDSVLLRTASSLEYSIIGAYRTMLGWGVVEQPVAGFMEDFIGRHERAAARYEELTVEAGGEAWTFANPRLEAAVLQPILARIHDGATPATGAAIPASDDPARDAMNLAHGLESLAGKFGQELAGHLHQPELRQAAIGAGIAAVRRAALLALTINPDRPAGYTSLVAEDASVEPENTVPEAPNTTFQDIATPTTEVPDAPAPAATAIPTVSAVPSRFGSLGPVALVVGSGDENGVRLGVNLETPSLNSYVYAGTAAP